ncbi:MAG: Fic family protein [Anaerolineaceae bacterium]|nr:Fic family protein [Anaerolineaceae bacterium]
MKSLNGITTYLPNGLPPEWIWSEKLLYQLSAAERNLARLEEVGNAFPIPHIVIRPFVRKEAVQSSLIEGTRTTFEELLTFEAHQMNLPELFADRQEVQNYVYALDYGLERMKTLPISLRLIQEIHNMLMNGVRGQSKDPGEFRKEQNWIGRPGATLETYVPPAADDIPACLTALEGYIYQESDLPSLIRIALIHYQFEAIHPFQDGNGRIGRLLIIFLMIHWGLLSQPYLYLSHYLENNRTEYYDRMLAVSQKGAWEEWISFFLEGVQIQADDAVRRIQSIQQLRMAYKKTFASDRSRENLAHMLDYFISTPISTVAQTKEKAKLGSFSTIQRYMDKLVEYGILEELTGNKRNRLYRAKEVMRVLQS